MKPAETGVSPTSNAVNVTLNSQNSLHWLVQGMEKIHTQVPNNPATAVFNVMIKRRRPEVNVSTLSAQQKRDLAMTKRQGAQHVVGAPCVEAASRQGISPSALMKTWRVVAFKDDGQLQARLVVQGFTDQHHGKVPNSPPNASRRSRQIFLILTASLGVSVPPPNVFAFCHVLLSRAIAT